MEGRQYTHVVSTKYMKTDAHIYGPYVNLHCRFEIDHCRALLEELSPEEREKFEFDPA